jgi:hypothetical protein
VNCTFIGGMMGNPGAPGFGLGSAYMTSQVIGFNCDTSNHTGIVLQGVTFWQNTGNAVQRIPSDSSGRTAIRNCPGYNPAGVQGGGTGLAGTTPSFPATTVNLQNVCGFDVQAVIVNGASAITVVSMGAYTSGAPTMNATGLTIAANATQSLIIPAGGWVSFTYAGGAPTWKWSRL